MTSSSGAPDSATDRPVADAAPGTLPFDVGVMPVEPVSAGDERVASGVVAVEVSEGVSWGALARVVSVLIDTMLSNSRGLA
jgi:hypothetical protein